MRWELPSEGGLQVHENQKVLQVSGPGSPKLVSDILHHLIVSHELWPKKGAYSDYESGTPMSKQTPVLPGVGVQGRN